MSRYEPHCATSSCQPLYATPYKSTISYSPKLQTHLSVQEIQSVGSHSFPDDTCRKEFKMSTCHEQRSTYHEYKCGKESWTPELNTSDNYSHSTLESFKAEKLTISSCHEKIIRSFSTNPSNIATILLNEGFITEEVYHKVFLNITPLEKASHIVNTIKDQIYVSPKQLHKFIHILSHQNSTKDVADHLQSVYRGRFMNYVILIWSLRNKYNTVFFLRIQQL